MKEFTLNRPRVPFADNQQADFGHLAIPTGCVGFKASIKIPKQAPYWRAGFVLAPEPYISEGENKRSILEYFLFHIGRGAGSAPAKFTRPINYVGYLECTQVIPAGSFAEFAEPIFTIAASFRSARILHLTFGNRSASVELPNSYFSHLYLLAWGDGKMDFDIPVKVELFGRQEGTGKQSLPALVVHQWLDS